MIKKTIIILLNLILTLILFISCKNEKNKKDYTVEGNIVNYNGKIYLFKATAPKYYFNQFDIDSAVVTNGKFEFIFSKEIEFPLPFILITENNIRTDRFILEPKNQKLFIDSLINKTKPRLVSDKSSLYLESNIFYNKTKSFYNNFNYSIDSIKKSNTPKKSYLGLFNNEREKLSHKINLFLVDFSKDYPESYFVFWEIVIRHMYQGYSKEIENSYQNLSTSIKKTRVAKLFYEDLIRTKSLNLGNKFPEINLKNKKQENIAFNVSDYSGSKFILIDFWFSNCAPCIRQFPKLKELYLKKHPEKLEIIGISIDKTNNLKNWYDVIDKNRINWKHLLDVNGIESSKLSINSFPTNFLLNSEGIILKKNMSLEELELLLKE